MDSDSPRDKKQAVGVVDMLQDLGQVHYICAQGTKFWVFFGDLKKIWAPVLIIYPYRPGYHLERLAPETSRWRMDSKLSNSGTLLWKPKTQHAFCKQPGYTDLIVKAPENHHHLWQTFKWTGKSLCLDTPWCTFVAMSKPQRISQLLDLRKRTQILRTMWGKWEQLFKWLL